MMHKSSKTHILIDARALLHNLSVIKNKIAINSEIASVVKSDAYGLGASMIAKYLYKNGVGRFYVNTMVEGLNLADLLPGATIHTLHPIDESDYINLKPNIVPVLNSIQELISYAEFGQRNGAILPAVLFFETGMGRLGIQESEIAIALKYLHLIDCKFIASHMSCADELNHPLNLEQLSKMQSIARYFDDPKISFSNSAGIWLGENYHFHHVRAGAALYGINPVVGFDCGLKQVVKLYGRVLLVKTLERDQAISYGAGYQAKRGDKIATIECGYSDGYRRSLSGESEVFYAGYRLKVVGRVTMDMIMVDVTALPQQLIDEMTHVEMLGDNITVDELAQRAGTIGYEILTGINKRIERILVE